jgi:amino acid adenylation domain-containing protein
MEIIQLLKELKENNIDVYLHGNDLEVNYDSEELPELFYKQIKEQKEAIIAYLKKAEITGKGTSIPILEPSEHYPLSSSQRRLWVLDKLEAESGVYNIPSVYNLKGRLNRNKLELAFNVLIARHEILRTVFVEGEDGEAFQVVKPQIDFRIDFLDTRNDAHPYEDVNRLIGESIGKTFDLSSGPLLRASLYQLTDVTYIMTFVMHHIISDGWSMGVLIQELIENYQTLEDKRPITRQALRIHYKDYASWQQSELRGCKLEEHKKYWMETFNGELPVLELPTDRVRPLEKTFNGQTLTFKLSEASSAALKNYCLQKGGTLFMGLLSTVNALLYHYTNQSDIIVGSPIAGREHADLEDQIGFYLNTLALRTQFSGEDSFNQLFSKVREITLGAYEHQVYPFDELVNALNIPRDFSRSLLFDVMIILQNATGGNGGMNELHDLTITPYEGLEAGVSKFDLSFYFTEMDECIHVSVEYNCDLFEQRTIERITDNWKGILESCLQTPDKQLREIEFLSEKESDVLKDEFNATKAKFREDVTLVTLFEEQVLKSPGSIALNFKDVAFTFQELNECSNQLGHFLRQKYDIRPDDLIAVKLERSEWMILSLLAVLKSGAAYIPIDPQHPDDRVAYLMKDSNSKALIDEALLNQFKQERTHYSCGNLLPVSTPDSLAYVIYTSGSTGQPKGCMLEHAGVVNRIEWMWHAYRYSSSDVILQKTTYTFDVSVWELFMPLCWGTRMVLCEREDVGSPDRIIRLIEKHGVTCLHFVPSMLNAFIGALHTERKTRNQLRSLRCVITSGEALPLETVKSWYEMTDTVIHNLYGPTEASVDVSHYTTSKDDKNIPIGLPIWNTELYVLDNAIHLLPLGAVGEICIAGVGLARGYLNQPQLTKERFVEHPFKPGKKMYRTGDLGRWLPDGNMEYLGRRDDQVKIHGYRIELDEIKSVLLSVEEVDDAVVVCKSKGSLDKSLIAYVVSKSDINDTYLKMRLERKLPSYMVPACFIRLDSLPLTSSGKVNRRALPAVTTLLSNTIYVPPVTGLEIALAGMWKDILGAEKVGLKDSFFELGGHSLKAIRLLSRIHREFKVKLELKELFSATTLEAQTLLILRGTKVEHQDIPVIPIQNQYPVSSSQKRLWVLDKLDGIGGAYHIPAIYELKGDLDVSALTASFQALMMRHESLRTLFTDTVEGEPMQRIVSDLAWEIEQFDWRTQADQTNRLEREVNKMIHKPFNLYVGPLIRAFLYRLTDSTYVFGFVTHHIISDGWSMGILVKELFAFYDGEIKGSEYNPEPLRIQYKDYSCWQRKELSDERLEENKDFWLNQLGGALPVLELPSDYPRANVKTYQGKMFSTVIPGQAVNALKEFVRDREGTLFMGLLATLNALLFRYSNQRDIIIGSPIAGREHADLENQIGFYVNTLALRTRLEETDNFDRLFAKIKSMMFGAYRHQLFPFDELVNSVQVQRDVSRNPLFDVMLALHNTTDSVTGHVDPENLSIKPFEIESPVQCKFDLTFNFSETQAGLELTIEYSTDLYQEATIRQMALHVEQILENGVAFPEKEIGDLKMMSDQESDQLIHAFNNTAAAFPEEETLTSLFEKQVALNPGSVALTFKGVKYTFGELNKEANRLAHYLKQEYQIQPDDRIALRLRRSERMIIALLAVLKSGGAYVPVDPDYPEERVDYILSDSSSKVLIDEEMLGQFDLLKMNYKDINPAQEITSSHLAYLIYTSGSTGQPKGCMVAHKGVVNRIDWMWHSYQFGKTDVIMQKTTYAFDVSVWELFMPLCWGASMVLCEQQDVGSPERILELIREHNVTCLHFVPSMLNAFIGNVFDKKDIARSLQSLRYLATSGEALSAETVEKWYEKTDVPVINLYGPTEASIEVSYYPVRKGDLKIPIGQPIWNTQLYVLDSKQRLLPMGVKGEICIGGIGLAKGYMNKPELSAEKFIPNPFKRGEKIYRTGDLGRWLADGTIEYQGRLDDQVKIRGYRIELDEISGMIQRMPSVKDAVVVCKKDHAGDPVLVAYYTANASFTEAEVKTYLGDKLPVYMIPAHCIQLDLLPLTESGKVNRKALIAPEMPAFNKIREYTPPRNDKEMQITSIWKGVLGVERIGIRDNFFEAGGDSLKAIRLHSLLRQQMRLDIRLMDIYKSPTIEGIAGFSENDSILIPVGVPGAEKKEIYFIPPILGNPGIYQSLVKAIPGVNGFGFSYKGFDRKEPFFESIEEMAKQYAKAIADRNPPDGFLIVGYSMGALIAFEMVRILETTFENVTLVLLDKEVPNPDRRILSLKELKEEGNRLKKMNEKFGSKELKNDPGYLDGYLLNYLQVMQEYQVSGRIRSAILAFEATGNPYPAHMKEWNKLTKGRFRHSYVSGSHWEMLSKLNVIQMADVLNSAEMPVLNTLINGL